MHRDRLVVLVTLLLLDLGQIFRLHIRLIIAPTVHRHRLINQQPVVHRRHEQLLRVGQTFALRCPDV
uniref:Putative secreted protein n=1 Tax=Anopheles darlingi TaxID=43151 RepID=A0A2M4D3H2_ANODA